MIGEIAGDTSIQHAAGSETPVPHHRVPALSQGITKEQYRVQSIVHRVVNPLQPLEPAPVAARYGWWRTFLRELRARQNLGGKSELTRGARGKQGQQRGDH